MLTYWCVAWFYLLLNNAKCDIWYHYFYRSKLSGGRGAQATALPLVKLLTGFYPRCQNWRSKNTRGVATYFRGKKL